MRIFFILLALVAATWVILDRFPTEQDKYPGYTILRWATDANPARWDQIRTFNELHEKDRIRVLLQPRAGVATDVQLSGRRGPDLVDIYSPTAFFNYASQGVLLDVTDRAERGGIGVDDVWPAAQAQIMHEDRLYALPTNSSVMMMYYNKNVFDDRGVPYPPLHWTWEEFVETARKLTHVDEATELYESFGYQPWGGQLALNIWGFAGEGRHWGMDETTGLMTRSLLNDPPFQSSYDLVHRCVLRDQVSPRPGLFVEGISGEARNAGLRLFLTDRVGMVGIGRWVLSTGWKYPGLRYGVTTIPSPPGVERPGYLYLGRSTAITRDCRHPEAAWKFLQYLLSPEYNRILVAQGDGVAAPKQHVDADWHLFQPEFPEVQIRMYERIFDRFEKKMSEFTGESAGLTRRERLRRCYEAWLDFDEEKQQQMEAQDIRPLQGLADTELARAAATEWGRLSGAEQRQVRDEVTAELRLNLDAMTHARQPIPSPYCFGPQWGRIFGDSRLDLINADPEDSPLQFSAEAAELLTQAARRNADPNYGREKYRIGGRIGLAVVAAGAIGLVIGAPALRRRARRAMGRNRPVIAGRRESWSERLTGLAFVAPNFAGFFVFTAFPVVFSIVIAFTEWDTFAGTVRWTGFDNFVDVFWNADFWFYFANTIILLLSIPVSILGSLVLASILNRRLRGTVVFRTLFYIPSLVSGVAVLVMWKFIFEPRFGLLNSLIRGVLPGADPPAWLTSEGFGWPWLPIYPAIYMMGIWGSIGGTSMLLYLAGLSNIPPELYEAAEIDGAGKWARFWRVTVPLVAPTTFFIVVMSMIAGLQGGTDLAFVMTNGGPDGATTTLGFYMFQEGFFQFRMGIACAAAWVLFAFIFTLTWLTFRYGNRGYF